MQTIAEDNDFYTINTRCFIGTDLVWVSKIDEARANCTINKAPYMPSLRYSLFLGKPLVVYYITHKIL